MRPESLLAQYRLDLSGLTAYERLRLAAYAGLIFAPLITVFLAWLWLGPGLEQILATP